MLHADGGDEDDGDEIMSMVRSDKFKPRGLLLSALLTFALVLAACGGGGAGDVGAGEGEASAPTGGEQSDGGGTAPDDIEAAAKEEGEVTFYSSLPETKNAILAAAFEDKYGISVNAVRAGSLKILQRLYEELQVGAPQADVFHSLYPPGFYQLKDEGYLATYESPEFDSYPDSFVDPDGKWGTLRVVANVIEYNTTAMGDLAPPERWEDLLKPEYQGQLASADPTYGGTQFMQYFMWKEKYGDDFIRQLGQQDLQMVDSHGALSSLIVSGERPIAIEMNDYQAWSDKYLDDAPVEYVYPPENVLVVPGYVSVLEGASHPNAGRLFLDFLLSAEGQQLIQEEVGAYSARDDAQPIEGRPKLGEIDQYQPDWQYLKDNIDQEQTEILRLLRGE